MSQNEYNNYLSPTHKTKSKRKDYYSSESYYDSADSDTLDSMESGSPINSFTNRHQYRTNNQSVRHRLHHPQTSSLSTKSTTHSKHHRYYRRSFKKFKPSYSHKKPKRQRRQHQQNSALRIIAGTILFLIAFSIYYAYGDYLTITALKQNHHSIIQFIATYPIFSPLIFILFECIVVGLTIPGATVLSMAAGTITFLQLS